MSEDTNTPDPLDVASIAAALVGNWCYPTTEERDGIGYLHFTADGRAFQFFPDPKSPEKRLPARLWYAVESPSTLRIRAKGSPDGWVVNYNFDGTTLTLFSPKRTYPCRRLAPDEIPGWFRDALATQLPPA